MGLAYQTIETEALAIAAHAICFGVAANNIPPLCRTIQASLSANVGAETKVIAADGEHGEPPAPDRHKIFIELRHDGSDDHVILDYGVRVSNLSVGKILEDSGYDYQATRALVERYFPEADVLVLLKEDVSGNMRESLAIGFPCEIIRSGAISTGAEILSLGIYGTYSTVKTEAQSPLQEKFEKSSITKTVQPAESGIKPEGGGEQFQPPTFDA